MNYGVVWATDVNPALGKLQNRHSKRRLKGADEAAKELRFRFVLQAGLGDTPHSLRRA